MTPSKLAVMSPLLAALVVACGGGVAPESEPPADLSTERPAKRRPSETHDAPDEDPSSPETPAPEPPLTCESVASLGPAGTFTADTLKSPLSFTARDVFVEEETRKGEVYLVVRFTEHVQECAMREAGLLDSNRAAFSFVTAAIGLEGEPVRPGAYAVDHVDAQAGTACLTPGQNSDTWGTGTSRPATGTIFVTKRTDSSLEGTFDLAYGDDVAMKGSFVAPICKARGPAVQATCCGRSK